MVLAVVSFETPYPAMLSLRWNNSLTNKKLRQVTEYIVVFGFEAVPWLAPIDMFVQGFASIEEKSVTLPNIF